MLPAYRLALISPLSPRGAVRASSGLALLALAACTREADYAQVRHDCEDELEQLTPTHSAADVAASIQTRCATTLGESIGLDWESFGFEPSDLGPSDTGGYLLAGLLVMAGDDTSTLSAVLADPDLPVVASTELLRMSAELELDDSTASSEVWYSLLHQYIASTTFAGSVLDGAGGAYSASQQAMVLSPAILGWDGTLAGAALPAYAASALLHEASHGFTEPHAQCTNTPADRKCDPSREGSYGIQVWWLHDWVERHSEVLADPGCLEVENLKAGACIGRIEGETEWEPCERTCL